jgi:cell division transport system ATP-binding protein
LPRIERVPLGGRYIALQDVEVRFSDLVWGLRGVSLEISRGEFVFLVGKTGAGKSTLLKTLTREVRHTSGLIRVGGHDPGRLRTSEIPLWRRAMGIVPQDFALLPKRRVWENVGYAMRAVGATKAKVRKRVPEILEMVHIGHRADAFPHELSGGEQQRVAIARALINDPPLLIADEPTGNLDFEHSMGIMELLAQLNARGTTVLVASHDFPVIEKMQRRVVRLEEGRVVEDARPDLRFDVEEATPSLFEQIIPNGAGLKREPEAAEAPLEEAVDA